MFCHLGLCPVDALDDGQWARGGIHARRGRLTADDLVSMMSWHGENHLDQLKRAREGRAWRAAAARGAEESPMATIEEYAKQPFEQRLERMSRTPDELAAAIRGRSDAVLSRRPDPKNWAAKEVICHLRDVEEVYFARSRSMVLNDVDMKIYADASAVERWATNRQYLRWDATEAVAGFRELREGFLGFLRGLTPADRQRGCIHPVRGRVTIDFFVSMLSWHDDNHLDQIARALEGRA